MLMIVFLIFVASSFEVIARIDSPLPEQNITINVKYDKDTRQFYDLELFGSNYFDFQINESGFRIKHGRDGFVGMSTVWKEQWIRIGVSNGGEQGVKNLVNVHTGERISYQVGLISAYFKMRATRWVAHSNNSQNCLSTQQLQSGMNDVIFNLRDTFSSAWCNTQFWEVDHYNYGNDVRNIGNIDRMFRFSMDDIDNLSFGSYQGSFRSKGVMLHQTYSGNVQKVDEIIEFYNFTLTLEIKPSVNSFTIDSDSLNFSVNKQNSNINGKAQTGFTVQGSFLNSQAFDMTFNSSNSALCGEALCLANSAAGTTIPYMVNVFDPATLLEKPVSRSGQKVTIYADQDYRLSGGLFFEFDTDNTALSGTFNDILTVRVELKLI
ncbi:hypothetical protein ACRZ5S_06530 [Vibrio scophthalmi]|uniref:hypothetical protein n=1 Tax=Vibrio scophthalmi TaxID=45658 RepID=UPI003EC057B7